MAYLIAEQVEEGTRVAIGEPMYDVIVAKVIASRRATRSERLTVVVDMSTGVEVACYDPRVAAFRPSAIRIRSVSGPALVDRSRKIG